MLISHPDRTNPTYLEMWLTAEICDPNTLSVFFPDFGLGSQGHYDVFRRANADGSSWFTRLSSFNGQIFAGVLHRRKGTILKKRGLDSQFDQWTGYLKQVKLQSKDDEITRSVVRKDSKSKKKDFVIDVISGLKVSVTPSG